MDEDEVRIIFLGKTGSGKSSFMNTFLGEDKLKVSCSPKSQTQICQRQEKDINGRKYVVIDTPGVFDTDRPEEDVRTEIISSLVECAPGPHVFILVLKVDRYTREDQEVLSKIIGYFGEEAFDHLVMLFTHGDNLDKNMTIQDFINQSYNKDDRDSLTLEKISSKCGDRVHVIDNKYWNPTPNTLVDNVANLGISQETLREIYRAYRDNKYQISQLMSSVDKILNGKDSRFYTNPCLEELGRQIEEEERNILPEMKDQQSGNQSVDKEIRRQARERVRTKIGKGLAGVATGILLGALLGLGVGLAAPPVFVAGLIRAAWRKKTGQRPQETEGTVKNTEGAAAAAGVVAVTAGAIAECSVLAAGAATGIGAGVAAGILLVQGAVKGIKSGIDASKVSDNSSQAAQKVTDTVTENAKDFLKACWNVGSKDSRDLGSNNNDEQETLIKKDD